MATVPKTSEDLLIEIGADAKSARWNDFCTRYVPMMQAYLSSHFPTCEADDIIQSTLLSLMKVLPNYRYAPEEKGHFHNYLTGILRHQALAAVRKDQKDRSLRNSDAACVAFSEPPISEDDFKTSICALALKELMADDSIQDRTKEIFRRVVILNESPADVAIAFGIERNNVDQIKSRTISKLRKIISALEP